MKFNLQQNTLYSGTLNRHTLPRVYLINVVYLVVTFSTIWLDANNLYCLNLAKTFLLLDLHLTLYYQISFSALPLPSLLPFYFRVSLTQLSRSMEQANFTKVEILKWKFEFHKLGFQRLSFSVRFRVVTGIRIHKDRIRFGLSLSDLKARVMGRTNESQRKIECENLASYFKSVHVTKHFPNK